MTIAVVGLIWWLLIGCGGLLPRSAKTVPAAIFESRNGKSDESQVPLSQDTVQSEPNNNSGRSAEPKNKAEMRATDENKCVNEFDDLTDKWIDPSKKDVTMADVNRFVETFLKVPAARREECIHRALNLIPDEKVMLLTGILMNESLDKEIVKTVYNDILNRDEEVKNPILHQIFENKSHPCWADAVWILDAMGKLPQKK